VRPESGDMTGAMASTGIRKCDRSHAYDRSRGIPALEAYIMGNIRLKVSRFPLASYPPDRSPRVWGA
jgi:hypothetical protein